MLVGLVGVGNEKRAGEQGEQLSMNNDQLSILLAVLINCGTKTQSLAVVDLEQCLCPLIPNV